MSSFSRAGVPLSAREGPGPRVDAIDPSNSAMLEASRAEEQRCILFSFQGGREGRSSSFSASLEERRSISYQDGQRGRTFFSRALPEEEDSFSFQFDPGGGSGGAPVASGCAGAQLRRLAPLFPGGPTSQGFGSPVLQHKYMARLAHFSGPSRRRSGARFSYRLGSGHVTADNKCLRRAFHGLFKGVTRRGPATSWSYSRSLRDYPRRWCSTLRLGGVGILG